MVSKIFLSKHFQKIISERVRHFDCGRFDVCTMFLGKTVIAQHQFCSFTVYAAIVAVAVQAIETQIADLFIRQVSIGYG